MNTKNMNTKGLIVEREPEITIDGHMVKISQAEETRKSCEEAKKRFEKEINDRLLKAASLGICPFKRGVNRKCKQECAFYSDRGCMRNQNTKGKQCPFSNYGCYEDCMLYENGCSICKVFKKRR